MRPSALALALAAIAALQLLLAPVGLLGLLLVGFAQVAVSRRLGVSQTGIVILNERWAMHAFGIRADPAATALARALPNTSVTGLWLVYFPLWAAYRLTGKLFVHPRIPEPGREGIADVVVARTLCLDRIIARNLKDVEQVVVLGAGYDTRPYGELRREGLAFFELDQMPTQRLKVAGLRAGGIATDHVRYVTVDFRHENALERLRASGYVPQRRTLFLWEGVTLYLDEAQVRATLGDIRRLAAPGSMVVADFYGERFLRLGRGPLGRRVLASTNEPFRFGLSLDGDFEGTLHRFAGSVQMRLGETCFLGRHDPRGPFMVVAELRIQDPYRIGARPSQRFHPPRRGASIGAESRSPGARLAGSIHVTRSGAWRTGLAERGAA